MCLQPGLAPGPAGRQESVAPVGAQGRAAWGSWAPGQGAWVGVLHGAAQGCYSPGVPQGPDTCLGGPQEPGGLQE